MSGADPNTPTNVNLPLLLSPTENNSTSAPQYGWGDAVSGSSSSSVSNRSDDNHPALDIEIQGLHLNLSTPSSSPPRGDLSATSQAATRTSIPANISSSPPTPLHSALSLSLSVPSVPPAVNSDHVPLLGDDVERGGASVADCIGKVFPHLQNDKGKMNSKERKRS